MSEGGARRPRRSRWKPVFAAAFVALLLAVVGGLATDIGPWYQSLKKPSWQPPDFLFGPVWTTIYSLAAVAGVLAWRRADTASRREWTIGLFALNGFANVLWSMLFFRLQRPDWAALEVGFLWLTILLLIVYLGRFCRPSAWLLAPYLAWVTFASVLNFTVVRLNAPFVGR